MKYKKSLAKFMLGVLGLSFYLYLIIHAYDGNTADRIALFLGIVIPISILCICIKMEELANDYEFKTSSTNILTLPTSHIGKSFEIKNLGIEPLIIQGGGLRTVILKKGEKIQIPKKHKKANKPTRTNLTNEEYVRRYACRHNSDGSIDFCNHDLGRWELSTKGRLKALDKMNFEYGFK